MIACKGVAVRIVLLILALLAVGGLPVDAQEVVVFAVGEWPPFISRVDIDDGAHGLLVRRAFERAGIKVKYEYYPWRRAHALVQNGDRAVSFPWHAVPWRDNSITYSDPMTFSRQVVFFNKEFNRELDVSSPERMREYVFVGVDGYWYRALFAEKSITVKWVNSEKAAWRALEAGKVDAYISDDIVGQYFIREMFPGKAENFSHVGEYRKDALLAIFSERHPDGERLRRIFNEQLRCMKEDGEYERIMKRYMIR